MMKEDVPTSSFFFHSPREPSFPQAQGHEKSSQILHIEEKCDSSLSFSLLPILVNFVNEIFLLGKAIKIRE